MHLPSFKLGDLVAPIPIVQGGMAIRISTGSLAGAVAAAGGIGIIAGSGMAFEELKEEIRIAREIAHNGIVGVNIMFAAREFVGLVQTAVREKIDLIITGAGFSRDIFKIGRDHQTPILPIVSSGRLARTAKSCGALGVVVEGVEAGGHLGTDRSVRVIVPEVRAAVGTSFPVIGAGGIIDGKGIVEMLRLGANAVQMATRFVLAEECNAAQEFKAMYQQAKEDDVVIISSPVGMPGRSLKTPLVKEILEHKAPRPVGCDFCLKHCSLEYCIIQALINAQSGDVKNGVVFSGKNVWKIKDRSIKPAKKIIEELVQEAEEVL